MTFKELREKANLLNQAPSLSETNGFLGRLCKELERLDKPAKPVKVKRVYKRKKKK